MFPCFLKKVDEIISLVYFDMVLRIFAVARWEIFFGKIWFYALVTTRSVWPVYSNQVRLQSKEHRYKTHLLDVRYISLRSRVVRCIVQADTCLFQLKCARDNALRIFFWNCENHAELSMSLSRSETSPQCLENQRRMSVTTVIFEVTQH